MSDTYLVWSNEHGAWWKAGGWGYSTGLRNAGHFTRDEAIQICRQALHSAVHIGSVAEVPVRLDDVQEFMDGQVVPACVLQGKNE